MKTRNPLNLVTVVALSLFTSAANADSVTETHSTNALAQAVHVHIGSDSTLGTDRGGRPEQTAGTDRGGVTGALTDWLESLFVTDND